MRTTLQIDDDVLRVAKDIAAAEGRSVGDVVSRLARIGLTPQPRPTTGAFPTFHVPDGASVITPAMVQRALDE